MGLGGSEVVAQHDALPGGEPVRLDDEPASGPCQLGGERAGRVQLAGDERPAARHPDPGRAGDLAAERLARLDPGSLARRAEDRDAGRAEGVGHAGGEGRLRTDHDELGRGRPGGPDDRLGLERMDVGQTADARLGADRGAARGDRDEVDAGLAGQLPGERVLPPAAADDEDPGRRHGQAHPATAPWIPAAAPPVPPGLPGPPGLPVPPGLPGLPGTVGRWRIGR